MMTEALLGQSLAEGESIRDGVSRILNSDTNSSPSIETAGELASLAGVRNFPARIKCATLPWHTYQAALRGEAKAVSE